MKTLYLLIFMFLWMPVFAQIDDPFDESNETEATGIKAAPLQEVFRNNWDSWGKGHQRISQEEFIACLKNPDYGAEPSAALVALLKSMKAGKIGDISLDEAISRSKGKMTSAYMKNIKKINGIKRELFANGGPTFSLMQQGPAGDCYFFSGTGWIVTYRIEEISRGIKTMGKEKFAVKFPGSLPVIVTAPTDAEMAFNDSPSTLSDGIWMPVLEKALGVVEGMTNQKRGEIPDPTARIDLGGSGVTDVKLWTGHEVIDYKFGVNAGRREVRDALIRMREHRLMAQASVPKDPKGKLPSHHVYAIMDFDPKTEMLTVWNPWGTSWKPKGPDSPENGYARDHGIFQISLDDFMLIFYYMAVENP